jgi:protein gp37
MADKSRIEWTDATWNCLTGCSRVHAGCDHCYAVGQSVRNAEMGQPQYVGLTVKNKKGDTHFNGVVRCLSDRLDIPRRWKRPRRIFVNAMSDVFHPKVPVSFIVEILATIAMCPQHDFQILTKRPGRMREVLTSWPDGAHIRYAVRSAIFRRLKPDWQKGYNSDTPELAEAAKILPDDAWPLKNLIVGCSPCNQETLDEFYPELAKTPAAMRFISLEPLLGEVDLATWFWSSMTDDKKCAINLVIVGGESGAKRSVRPMHPYWVRKVRDQCLAAGVDFFFKQWGVWKPVAPVYFEGDWLDDAMRERALDECGGRRIVALERGGGWSWEQNDGRARVGAQPGPGAHYMCRVRSKKEAGRLLDGVEWNQLPERSMDARVLALRG